MIRGEAAPFDLFCLVEPSGDSYIRGRFINFIFHLNLKCPSHLPKRSAPRIPCRARTEILCNKTRGQKMGGMEQAIDERGGTLGGENK